MFNASVMEAMRAHAVSDYPHECCGLVVGDKYQPTDNIHGTPTIAFKIADETMTQAIKGGQLQAVIHSHPGGPEYPSATDMTAQSATAVPFVIIPVYDGPDGIAAHDPFWFGDDCRPIPELIGRPFRHGVTDCYSIIRDWYRLECEITLPDYPRDWEWWQMGGDLYSHYCSAAGFVEIAADVVRMGDIALIQIRAEVINHAGVYIGDGLLLHQLGMSKPFDPSRLSCREPVTRWRNHIRRWVRYQND